MLGLTDTLGTGVFEVVCDILDVNDWDELLDRVLEPLADDEGPVVLLTDSDADTVADKLAVCVSELEIDTVTIMLVDSDAVSEGGKIVELTDLLTDIDEVGSTLCVTDVLWDTDLLNDIDDVGSVLCDTDLLTDIDEVGSTLCVTDVLWDTDRLADNDKLGSVLCDTDLLTDSDADEDAVSDKLTVCVTDIELAILLTDADEVIVPTCVAESDGLPDSVIDASLEILWLTLTLLLTVADEVIVPDNVSLTDKLLEASDDTDIDVESEELTDAVGWLVTVKLDV
jgi:hypothetical protein